MQAPQDDVQPTTPQEEPKEHLKVQETSEQLGGGEDGVESEGKEGSSPKPSTTKLSTNDAAAIEPVATPTNAVEPASSQTTVITPTPAPFPSTKRFSSATISKKFMQKAASLAPGGPSSPAGNSSTKSQNVGSSSSVGRPTLQTPHTQPSRLVTAKLTTSAVSSASSTGWNTPRPGSAVASAHASPAQTPSVAQASNKPSFATPNGVQPSDRSSTVTRQSSSARPWGDVKKTAPSYSSAPNEFPTAAEVAQGKSQSRPPKTVPNQPNPAGSKSTKETDNFTTDAFRGVHLDPNAHHWDEDDGEDSDFLGNVLEFGDGTQYSVPPTATAEVPPDLPSVPPMGQAGSSPHHKPSPIPNQRNGFVKREDRFSDDFDRSWPRGVNNTRTPSLSGNSPLPHPKELHSPAHSHSSNLPSDRERDKVLFNERSNRLEPYGGAAGRSAWGRKDSDNGAGRGSRFTPRDRDHNREQNASNSPTLSPFSRGGPNRPQWNDRGRQDSGGPYGGKRTNDFPPRSPIDGSAWVRGGPRRMSNTVREEGLGLSVPQPLVSPDHIENTGVSFHRRPSESTTGRRPSVAESIAPSIKSPLNPPSVLSTPANVQSELAPLPASQGGIDLEGITKMAMHTAAERARLRRQEEEVLREKERERARAKAVAIEVRLKAAKDKELREQEEAEKKRAEDERRAKEKEEEEARRAASVSEMKQNVDTSPAAPALIDPLIVKPPSAVRPRLQLLPRSIPLPQSAIAAEATVSSTPEASKSASQPMAIKDKEEPPGLAFGSSSTHDVMHFLEGKHEGDLEVVDYSEMARVMGAPQTSTLPRSPMKERTRRPVASDFFEDPSQHSSGSTTGENLRPRPFVSNEDAGEWRRGVKVVATSEPVIQPSDDQTGLPAQPAVPKSPVRRPAPLAQSPTASFSTTRNVATLSPTQQKTPYREASFASLSDTISRFRGALATVHSPVSETARNADETKESAAAAANMLLKDFATTKPNAVLSFPMSDPVLVKLSAQLPRGLVSQRQMQMYNQRSLPFRPDVLSWDPPIYNLSKRTLSRDELLLNGKSRVIRVILPRSITRPAFEVRTARVRLPPTSVPRPFSQTPTRGGFGRGAGVDEPSWRRPATETKLAASATSPLPPVVEVDAVSRSPPPTIISELPKEVGPSHSEGKGDTTSPTWSSRSKGKLPLGMDVAFYREDIQPDVASRVRFTVSSELDDPRPEEHFEEGPSHISAETTMDEKASDQTPSSQSASTLLTPPVAHATTWAKSPLGFPVSPARAEADPQGIKAVWEHPADKIATVENSLKDINDDFPAAIPLSVQDMKSDEGDGKADGETTSAPVPSSQRPDPPRISLQDAHRSFQVVPPSPATSNRAPTYQPLTPSAAPPRPVQATHPSQTSSPYMMPQVAPLPSPGGYGVRPFAPTPAPGMVWTPASPYMSNASLGPRLPQSSSTGPSPPIPQGMWMSQQQQPGTPFTGPFQYTVMPTQMGKPPIPSTNVTPPLTLPAGSGAGHLHMAPHMQGQGYPTPPPLNNVPHGVHPQMYHPRPPMMSPQMYNAAPPSSNGYGMHMGAGRGMGRGGFELPPPATPSLYPQMQNRFHPPPAW
ncbi:hypothetical protein FRB99_007941 [Tulasnella sp. 403]|nr:hypothetical protein FRB99_007941 [Tulasnella sp. 403]